ncbi:MAG: YesL family protein [Acetatifactor sp.]
MNKIFDPENAFWSFMNKVTDVFFLGILWFLFSLPVVTVGAATTALFQFTLKQADNEEGYLWRSFWKAFRSNFVKATGLWMIVLATGGFLLADIYACIHLNIEGILQMICFGVVGFLSLAYLLTAIYIFPLLSRFEKPVKTILFHSLVMAMGNLPVSVTILAVDGVFLVLTYYFPFFFPVFMGYAAFCTSYLYRFIFRRYCVAEGNLLQDS